MRHLSIPTWVGEVEHDWRTDRAFREDWLLYAANNANAARRYERDRDTVDRRYVAWREETAA